MPVEDSKKETRGTMLVSSALILSCFTFALGFVGGSAIGQYRAATSSVQDAAVAPAPSQPQVQPQPASAEAELAHLREHAQQEPGNAAHWTALGNACYDSGRFDEAIAAYENSLRLEPGNANVMTDLGSMFRMKGQPQKAIQCYEQAMSFQPGHANAVFNKGVTLLLDMEQPEQAMAFWQSVLDAAPDFTVSGGVPLGRAMVELAVDGGRQLESHGRTEAALRCYAEALRLDGGFVPALTHRAWLLEKVQRPAEALPLWKRIVELDPDAADPAGRPIRDRIQQQ